MTVRSPVARTRCRRRRTRAFIGIVHLAAKLLVPSLDGPGTTQHHYPCPPVESSPEPHLANHGPTRNTASRIGSGGFELRGSRTTVRHLVRDIWRSRELLVTLARKDFFVRFRRTSFGVLWAVGLPLVQASVLAVVFTRVVRIETGGNYGIYVFSGMLPWTFLSGTVTMGSTSIVDGSALATKIYFPRALLPLVTLGANLYGFLPGVASCSSVRPPSARDSRPTSCSWSPPRCSWCCSWPPSRCCSPACTSTSGTCASSSRRACWPGSTARR